MSKDIRIRKGLDIKLAGEANKEIVKASVISEYGLVPDDLHGIIPRLLKRQGDTVKAGEGVYHAKRDERIRVVSPVSGSIKEIVRGEKRKILSIIISPESAESAIQHNVSNWSEKSGEDLKKLLCEAGFWPYIKQRPYDIVANPDTKPKAIFISAYNSAPIAADVEMLIKGKEEFLQTGIDALNKLTDGKVHLTLKKSNTKSAFKDLKNVEIHHASGPHPAGNVSTHIAKIEPINKGELIWVINPEDLAVLGELLSTGIFNQEKLIAVNGSQVKNSAYVKVKTGAKISDIISSFELENVKNRIIEGNPISGTQIKENDFLGLYTNQLVILEEGDDYDLFGWNKPQPNKFSVLRANMFSFLTPNKKYKLNTNTNGEERSFVLNSIYQEVFPLDIYPVQLMKSCLYKDIDEMEKLGIYEVAPEDFALTEFVCVSKLPHQNIIRAGLDLMIKEVG